MKVGQLLAFVIPPKRSREPESNQVCGGAPPYYPLE